MAVTLLSDALLADDGFRREAELPGRTDAPKRGTAVRVRKLTDFRIAARVGGTGAEGGTPLYMAPEQWHGTPEIN